MSRLTLTALTLTALTLTALTPHPPFRPCPPCRLKELHGKCPQEFNAYAECMDYNSNNLEKCRAQQKAFRQACPL